MSVFLRVAGKNDLSVIVALMNAAFRGEGEQRGWSTESAYVAGDRTSESLLIEEMTEHVRLLVAENEANSKLDGCVSLKRISPEKWYLGSLAVDPARQNSGFGRKLLEASEDYIASRGGSLIEITVVNIRSALISWYERRGYCRTGEIRSFPYTDKRFGRPLREDLAFVVLEKNLSQQSLWTQQ